MLTSYRGVSPTTDVMLQQFPAGRRQELMEGIRRRSYLDPMPHFIFEILHCMGLTSYSRR